MSEETTLLEAAQAIAEADALLIGAGAGMGVDSGLPDFRGDHGFWNAYPPYAKLGLNFIALANPRWFRDSPELAWGFYGHRMNLYRATPPHAGFQLLRKWAARMTRGAFVYTSNVDGHFQRAGFDPERIVEVHGACEWMQCTLRSCSVGLIEVERDKPSPVTVNEETMLAVPPLPVCPQCSALLRPNILMFGDAGWDESRSWQQEQRFNQWLQEIHGARLAIVECGAGTAIPTVRLLDEHLAAKMGGKLIRLNIREPQVPAGHIGLSMGALAALRAIDERLG